MSHHRARDFDQSWNTLEHTGPFISHDIVGPINSTSLNEELTAPNRLSINNFC